LFFSLLVTRDGSDSSNLSQSVIHHPGQRFGTVSASSGNAIAHTAAAGTGKEEEEEEEEEDEEEEEGSNEEVHKEVDKSKKKSTRPTFLPLSFE
jgi:ribosomal protein L12E/L44/L45/RPP1/RPP2